MSRNIPTALAIAFAVAACAGGETRPENLSGLDETLKELTHQDGRACIRASDLDGFGTLSSQVVSASTRLRGKYYLLTTLYRCPSLTSAVHVGFQDHFSEYCGGSAKLHTGEESCPVRYIFEFPSREDAMAAWEMAKARREVEERYKVAK